MKRIMTLFGLTALTMMIGNISQATTFVDTLIACRDGSSVTSAADELNRDLNDDDKISNGSFLNPFKYEIRKPFQISAPSISKIDDNHFVVCVTLTRE